MAPSSLGRTPALSPLVQRLGLPSATDSDGRVGSCYVEAIVFPREVPQACASVGHLPKIQYQVTGGYTNLAPFEIADLVLSTDVVFVRDAVREEIPAGGRRRFLVAGLNKEGGHLLLTRDLSDKVLAVPYVLDLTFVSSYIPLLRR